MENQPTDTHPQIALINNFCEITACASKSDALFFLESHNFDIDAAVSTFIDNANPSDGDAFPIPVVGAPIPVPSLAPAAAAVDDDPSSPLDDSPNYSPSGSPLRSARFRSPSPPLASRSYNLRSAPKPKTRASGSGGGRKAGDGGVRTLADLQKNPKDEDSDSDPDFDPPEYYTGGEKSGMLVRDPSRANDVDAIFNRARQMGATDPSSENHLPSSRSRSFAGTGRLLSGEVSSAPQPPANVSHNITFWRNGFTVDDGPLRRLDDPANSDFLESIQNSECPNELASTDRSTGVHVNLIRKEEDYREPERPRRSFQGVGRTLGNTSSQTPTDPSTVSTTLMAAPAPSIGLVIDAAQPSTSIQLRLADGTRMVSRFNNHHTIRDVRGFIDASRPDGPRDYQLQSMGFPPKQLTNLDQTIDDAGIGNSVVIQKL